MAGPATQLQGFQLTADASGRRSSASGKGGSAKQPVAELAALPGASKLARKDTPTLQVCWCKDLCVGDAMACKKAIIFCGIGHKIATLFTSVSTLLQTCNAFRCASVRAWRQGWLCSGSSWLP
jgi:hypothetical protein